MKKALVIANMMFASVTVFGMVPNDGRCDQQIGNHSNMKNMKDISPAKKIGSLWAEIIDGYEKFFNTINEDGNNPMQVAKKKEELKIKLDKALKTSQSGLKHNKWVQEEVKQILSQITSEDIWEYIKKSHISSSSREDSYEIEKSAKKKAKDFFILISNKNLCFFPVRIAPCFVSSAQAPDHLASVKHHESSLPPLCLLFPSKQSH